jgi:hypothetical protein
MLQRRHARGLYPSLSVGVVLAEPDRTCGTAQSRSDVSLGSMGGSVLNGDHRTLPAA